MLHTTAAPGIQNIRILSADTLTGDTVVNRRNEDLGKIEHLMIDIESGRVIYAVLSCGGFLGMGDKLFAIPWKALTVDMPEKRFVLDVDKKRLEQAPGFDKSDWPDMGDRTWGTGVFKYYGAEPY
ncbi:MAG: PRC-barrel domain-containing protein [Bryobacteraceae bacterium]|nr:PRC-barrel domain-containing protein [Bryobacteraceae bacterium]